jgi:hypothetical protein
MKFKNYLVIIVIPLMLNGCLSSYIKNEIKQTDVGQKINIHENPQIGDYAVLKDSEDDTEMIQEIIDIKNNSVHIKFRIKFNLDSLFTTLMGSVNNSHFEFLTDKKGKTLEAYFIDPENNEKDILGISNEKIKTHIVEGDYLITTKAGNFKTKLVWHTEKDEEGILYNITFLSKNVKFNTVRSFTFSSKKKFEKFISLSINKKIKYKPENIIELVKQGKKNK